MLFSSVYYKINGMIILRGGLKHSLQFQISHLSQNCIKYFVTEKGPFFPTVPYSYPKRAPLWMVSVETGLTKPGSTVEYLRLPGFSTASLHCTPKVPTDRDYFPLTYPINRNELFPNLVLEPFPATCCALFRRNFPSGAPVRPVGE